MSWSWYGNLSCLQWFRSSTDAERFERAYYLLNQSLSGIGFQTTFPSYVHGRNWTPSAPPLGIIRAAWSRRTPTSEEIVALGLPSDDERFDYQAWVGSTDSNGLMALLSDLNRVNQQLLHTMESQMALEAHREQAKEYRNSVKEMLPLGAFPAIGDISAGVLPSVPGLPTSIRELLPWISGTVVFLTIIFCGFVVYYVVLLGRTEWRIRRAR